MTSLCMGLVCREQLFSQPMRAAMPVSLRLAQARQLTQGSYGPCDRHIVHPETIQRRVLTSFCQPTSFDSLLLRFRDRHATPHLNLFCD